MKNMKKVVALILCLVMCFSIIPSNIVSAAGPTNDLVIDVYFGGSKKFNFNFFKSDIYLKNITFKNGDTSLYNNTDWYEIYEGDACKIEKDEYEWYHLYSESEYYTTIKVTGVTTEPDNVFMVSEELTKVADQAAYRASATSCYYYDLTNTSVFVKYCPTLVVEGFTINNNKGSGEFVDDNGNKVKVTVTVEPATSENAVKNGDFIEVTYEFKDPTRAIDPPFDYGDIVEISLLDTTTNYSIGSYDCEQEMKIDIDFTFSSTYNNVLSDVNNGTKQFLTYDSYFWSYNIVPSIDYAHKTVSISTCEGSDILLIPEDINSSLKCYTNFEEVTSIDNYESGDELFFFPASRTVNKTDKIAKLSGNMAILKLQGKFNADEDFTTWPTKLKDMFQLTRRDNWTFDFEGIKNYFNVYKVLYQKMNDNSYKTELRDIRANGKKSIYYDYWNEELLLLGGLSLEETGISVIDLYLDSSMGLFTTNLKNSIKRYSDFYDSFGTTINNDSDLISALETFWEITIPDEFNIKQVACLLFHIGGAACDYTKIEGVVDVIQRGSGFDDCQTGVIGYDSDAEHWWYACVNGGVGPGEAGATLPNNVKGAGYFKAYTYDIVYTEAVVRYIGDKSFKDNAYTEVSKNDFEVKMIVDGEEQDVYYYMVADYYAGYTDNKIGVCLYSTYDSYWANEYDYVIITVPVEKTAKPSSGKKKKKVVETKEEEVVKTPEEIMQEELKKDDVKKADSNEGEKINPNAKFIKGYDDGTFKPNKEVSNLELMCMVTQLYEDSGITISKEIDLNQGSNEWAGNVIAQANGLGLIPGNKDDKNYDIYGDVTRGNLAVVIYDLIKDYTDAPSLSSRNNCTDAIGKNYEKAAAKLLELGIFKGYDDGLFHGDNTLTRAEAVVVINRALISLGFEIKIDSLKVSFPDLSQSHWAYDEIMFAANK